MPSPGTNPRAMVIHLTKVLPYERRNVTIKYVVAFRFQSFTDLWQQEIHAHYNVIDWPVDFSNNALFNGILGD